MKLNSFVLIIFDPLEFVLKLLIKRCDDIKLTYILLIVFKKWRKFTKPIQCYDQICAPFIPEAIGRLNVNLKDILRIFD